MDATGLAGGQSTQMSLGSRHSLNLTAAVRRWPTPTMKDNRPTSQDSREKYGAGLALSEVAGGKLNPPWVEWLMGWPIGWTDLQPLGKDKFQQWLERPGKY